MRFLSGRGGIIGAGCFSVLLDGLGGMGGWDAVVDMVVSGLGTSRSYVCMYRADNGKSGSVTNVSVVWIWLSRCEARRYQRQWRVV